MSGWLLRVKSALTGPGGSHRDDDEEKEEGQTAEGAGEVTPPVVDAEASRVLRQHVGLLRTDRGRQLEVVPTEAVVPEIVGSEVGGRGATRGTEKRGGQGVEAGAKRVILPGLHHHHHGRLGVAVGGPVRPGVQVVVLQHLASVSCAVLFRG